MKGFTAEECESLSVLPNGRIAGDRVLGLRFANAAEAGDAWGTKHEFVALVNTPGLARLQLSFDPQTLRLQIRLHDAVLADETLNEGSRSRIAAAIEAYVLGHTENPLSAHPERLPLRIVGDGRTPRYQDSQAGLVSLHSRESLAAVAAAAGSPALSEQRFRSNIAIEGATAWEEQTWIGQRIRIGEVDFEAARPKYRCLATHANPMTGERDLQIMQTLLQSFAQEKPTFAIALTAHDSGVIRLGDEVMVYD
jgi:MOSC domain-containing protein